MPAFDDMPMGEAEVFTHRYNAWFPQALPYFLLLVSTALAALQTAEGYRTWQVFDVSGVLATMALAWQLLTDRFAGENQPRRVMAAWIVRLLLCAGLVLCNPWYGVFSWFLFVGAVHMPSLTRRSLAILGTALVMAYSYLGGLPHLSTASVLTYGLAVMFTTVLALGISYASIRQDEVSSRRRDAIVELVDTNERLEAALRENAGLHAQLVAQAREAGIADERRRMAGEIHDTLAQGLTGIVTQLQAAEQAEAEPEQWRRHLELAQRLARDSLTEARRSVHALRPTALSDTRLPEALAAVAREWSAINGVRADVMTAGEPAALRPDVEVALLRTGQEALANVAKHAHASRVGLTLSYMDDVVTLDVRDDGVGFDPVALPEPGPSGGFGLAALRQRVTMLDGAFAVESDGSGTALSASVPLFALDGVADEPGVTVPVRTAPSQTVPGADLRAAAVRAAAARSCRPESPPWPADAPAHVRDLSLAPRGDAYGI